MTKEELIELSDLNRKDNVKYISSEAQGIAIALDSDIYSPTLCKLERAYICGRRKSENRIAELEKENVELKEVHESDKRSLALIAKKGAELEKENAELRDDLRETKKLLAMWIDDRPYTVSEQEGLIADTEQFLKEE